MIMKQKITAMLLCAAVLPVLSGCDGSGQPDADTETAAPTEAASASAETETLPEIPEGAIADASGSFVYTGPLRQGGDDENGYIQVPLGYVSFQEEGVSGLTQYSDVSGTNIITLDHYADIDYQTAANNLRYYMQEDATIEGLTGATVQINGYNSLQLCCHFTDVDKFLVTWLIEDPADPADCYYLAIEFTSEDANVMACSSTFQTKEDYHAAAE